MKSQDKDIHHHARRLQEERIRLERETAFGEEDKENIRKYVEFLEAQGLSKGRLAKVMYQLRMLRKHLVSCTFKEADRKAIEQLVNWLNNPAYSAWSKSDVKG